MLINLFSFRISLVNNFKKQKQKDEHKTRKQL